MNNLITVENNNALAEIDSSTYLALKNSIYPGAKDESISLVINYCRAAKLDPMQKPVHIVHMWVKESKTGQGSMRDVIMPGIGLYRIQASRSGCAGISEPEFGEDITENLGGVEITYPKWCKITVKRIVSGSIVEFSSKEYWKENYANAGKDKQTGKVNPAPNAMWLKRPYGQLAKCAEAQALRKAFPEIGSMPTAEEMEGKGLIPDESNNNYLNKKGISRLKEKLGMTKNEPINENENNCDDYDIKTGEIIEESVGFTFDEVRIKMEDAKTIAELVEAADLARSLQEEDRKKLRSLYKERESKIAMS